MAVRYIFLPCLLGILLPGGLLSAPPAQGTSRGQMLRLVQDDAQDHMVSRIFTLKHIQANDIVPFVTGMVKRYNMNSQVSCFSYVYGKTRQQILSVTTPGKMMIHVADFLKKADRAVTGRNGRGDEIRGTGISRGVYRPRYRSGQVLIDLIVNALVNAGPFSSLYGYDANSNQIYWKDNASNTAYVYQFLSYIDRPPPLIRIKFSLFEIRESTLQDLGIEYLAWKNGPGLNLFQAGWQALDLSSSGSAALQSFSGPLGGFFFAPQFDASFIRMLAQSGEAEIRSEGAMTVSNSDSRTYEMTFSAARQNIVKNSNDRTSVTAPEPGKESDQCRIAVVRPVVCIDSGKGSDFSIPAYFPGENAFRAGTLYCGYAVSSTGAVERNNFGTELVNTTELSGNITIPLNREILLGSWERESEVTQTIGVPWLSEIPLIKYLFSTTTTDREKSFFYLTVTAELPDMAAPDQIREE